MTGPGTDRGLTGASLFFVSCLCLFIHGYAGSSLGRLSFLQQWRAGATLPCGAWASYCDASLAVENWPMALGTWALECTGFSNCGVWPQ